MNQYTEKKQVASLLKTTSESESSFKLMNGMVEFTIDNQKVYVPTAEAFTMLLKKVSTLEQRLVGIDNKVVNARRHKE